MAGGAGEGEVIDVGVVVRHSGRDRQIALGFGLRLAGPHAETVERFTALPSVIFVARTLGRGVGTGCSGHVLLVVYSDIADRGLVYVGC
ncbi:AsnC family transcriptional regulator [Mycobacteroides abscessus subsp. bolletii]|nr:AsnC family transcriptional regulator [Mycobacteroides abscessus subsp. bolletii]SHT32656.1 AsnC family transcriptional regulator [Mycobacteroides abscessus subsp. bolletii]SHT50899.1 AsnC family transcriptional regulator [Mycobacteroides abscessus subsp. bolletii]SKG63875.1 AsnC family transcriptional regulator [Mycobacteroides abscessus subsp. bolletii]SKH19257.1 AsnC family transcriptional regulator [Mycobacteroides abscessus subsp. bolletii]